MQRLIIISSLSALGAVAAAAESEGPPSTVTGTESRPAGTEGGGQGAPPPSGMSSMYLMIAMVVAFGYLIIVRPQRKEDKRRKEMVESIKRGDKVVTIGGVHGEVMSVGETTIEVKVDPKSDTVMTFNKGAVSVNSSEAARLAEAGKAKS